MSAQPSVLRTADRVGLAGSFLCAVHCAVLPLVLALLPAFGLKIGGWLDIDQAFVVFATLLGATTLTLGYRRHRVFRAWLWLVPGLGLVWLGAFTRLHNHTLSHAVVMTIGGLLLAAAHFINLRLTHAAAATTVAPDLEGDSKVDSEAD
ncbi:MAG: MerC domain-containing protein [Pseudomonadota bacterium]|nr:MerC domain-containing protein [Pseudomonadota bacterium]